MNIAQKVLRQKKDFDDVYEAGKKAEYDAIYDIIKLLENCVNGGTVDAKSWYDEIWDGIQDYGKRTNYTSGFRNWGGVTIDTKYPVNTTSLYEIFSDCRQLETLPNITCAHANGQYPLCYCAFQLCQKLKSIDFDVMNGGSGSTAWTSAFRYCQELVTIKQIGVLETQVFNKTFEECVKLEYLIVKGTIGQNGFDIHWSTKLTADSLKSIINALSTTTTGLTITLPTTAQTNYEAKYGTGSWSVLVASRSNWTIAYA